VLVAPNSTWRFLKGNAEASSPDATAWRQLDFDDSAWADSQAAFYYENQPGSSTAYTGNTVLADMFGHYTCIFLRQEFVVTNTYDLAALQIAALSDDGFIAWINGQDALRFDRISFSNLVCLLQFNTHTGRTCAIERLNVLRPTNTWVACANFIPSTNGPVTVSDPQAPAGCFYRLKVTRN
jgi:hypothetical protein